MQKNERMDRKMMNEKIDIMIGQMLMLGFRGIQIDENSGITNDIQSERCAGVILFDQDVALGTNDRNIESPTQIEILNEKLQSFSKQPLLIAIDQEGGMVSRLSTERGFPATVSQQYLGEQDDIAITAKYAAITAKTLQDAKINLNFAPDIDVNTNPNCPVIGKKGRSFSNDTAVVARHAEVLIDEHHRRNILCSIKHFPGHGSAQTDSHEGFTDVSDTWNELELIPFKKIIDAKKADIIMTAHIFNRHWDDKLPATLSKNVITGMLREKLGFDGVVITDDMTMGAITNNYGLKEAIKLSINAGCDMLLFANNSIFDPEIGIKAVNIINELLQNGSIPLSRIEESYRRIMQLKARIENKA